MDIKRVSHTNPRNRLHELRVKFSHGHGHDQLEIFRLYPIPAQRRDRIVVSTLRCGRNNPGSNPGHGNLKIQFFRGTTWYYFLISLSSFSEKLMESLQDVQTKL